ncbi:phage tail tape measure protein, partial [Clostridium sp.]|uniref:phage tail tape measure protein n=1 Tax=Clostridium sp. TaxID=1506 RepID=UPI001A501057
MAGNNIKGITVEINGETGPLQNALKGVNKSSYDLKQELKQVEKALKLDPTNTVLLQQKQELLAKSVTNTKDKLETLKIAEQQAQAKFAEGKISEEQYRALQREVINTEQELGRLETAAANSNSTLARISETSDKIAKGAKNVGTAMTPVTVAIGGVATGAVAAFTAVDEGMDIVIKKTGATGKTAEELETIYKDLASSVPDSMDQVGAAVGEINTRFEFTGETLKKASEDFLKFARINDMDVNSSVKLVSRAMGDAGIKSSEYNSVLDKLTVAAQKSGIGMDSLTTNLAKYGAPMRALGIDTDTSIAMFAGWEKAGVNTEIAFAGMKKAISNWGSQGKDSAKEFEKTLEAIKSAPDIASATSMAIDVFGQKAGPDLADAIQGGRFEVQDYIEALKKSEGAVTNTYAGIESGTDKAKTAFNALKVAGGELGETIMTTLTPILMSIAEKAKELATKFAGLSDGTKKTILIVMALIAGIAPLAFLISGIATIVGAVAGAFTIVSGAIAAATGGAAAATPVIAGLGAAIKFMMGPIGLTIIAVIALVAGFAYLWTHCEGFKAFW